VLSRGEFVASGEGKKTIVYDRVDLQIQFTMGGKRQVRARGRAGVYVCMCAYRYAKTYMIF